ncbi:MAG: protein-L-isoaspartate O-methyltransferase [Candidatus Pacearchaeota archaeon]|nr:protein-L-isoaspartate O-methyltransferase [Candidatus Pacearchaeota archaeon]
MDNSNLISLLKAKNFPEYIVNAFAKVKRENFVPENLVAYSYEDMALPVENGSTISQPSTIAFMLMLLEPKQGQKILEIGSGTGYVLALLSEIIKEGKIYGVEIIQRLAIKSKNLLQKDSNIEILNRDASNGLPEFAPYDRILISASCPEIPYFLINQLKPNGIIVAAVKQSIVQIKRDGDNFSVKEFPGFSFVPLVKKQD